MGIFETKKKNPGTYTET